MTMRRVRNSPRGEQHGRAKLTAAEVRAIFVDPAPRKEIALKYQISHSQISGIKRRKFWVHTTADLDPVNVGVDCKPKLTAADVLEIRASNQRGQLLAKRFGVTKQMISAIKHRKCWKKI